MANRKTATVKKREKFLNILKESGNVSTAAKRAGISRRIAYVWRDGDPLFAAEWDGAIDEYIEKLELEADRRAHDGVTHRLYFDKEGKLIGEIRRYSDRLLMFRLKALRPEMYRDPPQGIDPKVVQLFLQQVLSYVDEATRQSLIAWIEARMGALPFRNN